MYKDKKLTARNSIKFLGLTLDNSLSWKKHIEAIVPLAGVYITEKKLWETPTLVQPSFAICHIVELSTLLQTSMVAL